MELGGVATVPQVLHSHLVDVTGFAQLHSLVKEVVQILLMDQILLDQQISPLMDLSLRINQDLAELLLPLLP